MVSPCDRGLTSSARRGESAVGENRPQSGSPVVPIIPVDGPVPTGIAAPECCFTRDGAAPPGHQHADSASQPLQKTVNLMTNLPSQTASPVIESACSPLRALLIAGLALGLGTATNRWLNASTSEFYTGQVQVETLTLRAPVDGILQQWHVREGETVDPQVLLCQIGGHNLARKLQQQEQEVARLQARLTTLQAEVDVKLHTHLRELDSDIYQAELQTADLLQKKYYHELEAMAWRDTLTTYQQADRTAQLQAGVSSDSDSLPTDRQINALLKEEAASNSVEAITAQLKICSTRLARLKEQKQELRARMQQSVGVSETELTLAQARQELADLQQQLEHQYVRSTALGTIANFRKRPGEHVQAGEVLAEMYQMNESFVTADIPTSLSHRFEVDTTVRCRFPNGQTRTGVVTNVAIAASPAA